MKESRTIEINKKRFRKADVLSLASIFSEQAKLSKKGNCHFSISFVLRCKDGTIYESETPDVFEDEEISGVKPPKAIEMSFSDYDLGRRISLSAVHGGEYSDRFHVSGDDTKWVHDIFVRVGERFNALPPTDVWFTRHPGFTTFLGMLGLGSLLHLILIGALELLAPSIVELWRPSPETATRLRESFFVQLFMHPVIQFHVSWLCRWGMGGAPWLYFQRWLMDAYPSIELDFGPEHMKLAANRRARIRQFIVLVAMPLCAAVVYDIIKAIAQ